MFALRAIVAFTLPLTGDEAYYWEWSRRLAFGYVDHPPAVAWTIAAFAQFGRTPGLVRLGCVLCGAIAVWAAAACATRLAAGDRRAGAVTALALTVPPLASVAFGTASPDAPYLACWCLTLLYAARAFAQERRRDWIALGLALGGVLLSRMFGFALLFGIAGYALAPERRRAWRAGLGLSFAIALLAYVPFLLWNASHQWVTFAFSLVHRHENEHGGLRALANLLAAQAAAFSPGLFAAACTLALRPRNALLAWTALPLWGVLLALACFRSVEMYWIWGPYASLCVMLGIAYVELSRRVRTAWTLGALIPAGAMLALLFAVTLVPARIYDAAHARFGLRLHGSGPFELYAFAPLAYDTERIARASDAVVMTDGYGLSSQLDFHAEIAPVVIGYDWQGRESRGWYASSERPRRALFVDKVPLDTRPDFQRKLAQACGRVRDGGMHEYSSGGAPPTSFYFTWCERPASDALAILRWEKG